MQLTTDHNNLWHDDTKHTNQRVLRQRMAIDQEYDAKIEYFAGEINTEADRLSRLPFKEPMISKAFNDLFLLKSVNQTSNYCSPLDLRHIGKEQETDKELQHVKSKPSTKDQLGPPSPERFRFPNWFVCTYFIGITKLLTNRNKTTSQHHWYSFRVPRYSERSQETC